ncbi:Hypothetical protein FKW44_008867, partial [Caligus rogercresseyi]
QTALKQEIFTAHDLVVKSSYNVVRFKFPFKRSLSFMCPSEPWFLKFECGRKSYDGVRSISEYYLSLLNLPSSWNKIILRSTNGIADDCKLE